MRLGMFDPMEGQTNLDLGVADVDTDASRELSLRTSIESLVVLKNDGILPLVKSPPAKPRKRTWQEWSGMVGRVDGPRATIPSQKFAFIGPTANQTQDMLSGPQVRRHALEVSLFSHCSWRLPG